MRLSASAKSALSAVAVLLVAAVAYAPGLFHGFVFDDYGTIVENTFLENPANLGRVLTLGTLADPQVIDGQRPLLLLTSFLDRAVWGLNPLGWHLTSLLLHLACVALFYCLARRLSEDLTPGTGSQELAPPSALKSPICGGRSACDAGSRRPFFASLLFALHPALSEAVQMPSYREDLLLVLCVLAYLLACARGRAGWSLPWLGLALCAKESAAAAPALALALWGLFPRTRPPRRAVILHLAVAGLLLLAYAAPGFLQRPLQAVHGAWNGYSLRWPDNLLRLPGLFLFYLRLLVLPWPLCADRAVPMVPLLPGIVALAGSALLAVRLRRSRPLAAFGLLWLLIAFVPVSNLLPLFNPVGERYLYLMAPGFLLAAAGFADRRWLLPAGVAALVCFALVQVRLCDWSDSPAFWTAVRRVNPDSARAHTWLGLEAKARGDRAEAERLFARAEELNPHDVSALVNLAVLAGEAGDLPTAEARLRAALGRRSDRADVWQNLALALRLQGREAEASRAEAEAASRLPRW